MEDSFGKIVAILICVVQMFFIPLYMYSKNADRMEQTYIISEITYTVDNFRNTGIIEDEQYNNLRSKIYSLSGGYNIKVTHYSSEEECFDTMFFETDIEDELADVGYYYMKRDDYLNIYVEDKDGNIVACYGGSIKNEAY